MVDSVEDRKRDTVLNREKQRARKVPNVKSREKQSVRKVPRDGGQC